MNAVPHDRIDAEQAWIMPEAFQGDVLEIAEALGGKGIVQQRKLFVHDLIEKRIGLRRNADGNAVPPWRKEADTPWIYRRPSPLRPRGSSRSKTP